MDQITNVFVSWDGLAQIAVSIVAVMVILSVMSKWANVIFVKKIPVANFANFALRVVLAMLQLALVAKNVFVTIMKMFRQEFVIKTLVNAFAKIILKDCIVTNVWKVCYFLFRIFLCWA